MNQNYPQPSQECEYPLPGQAVLCSNCGAPMSGKYCSKCGQKEFIKDNYTILSLMKTSFHDITHFDSKFFQSLFPLLFKPGFLTDEYLSGRQNRYAKPISLFVFINLFFFLIGYAMDIGIVTKSSEILSKVFFYSGPAEKLISSKIAALNGDKEEFARQFHEAVMHNQKSMFLIIIPLFALVLSLLYWKPRRYFIEHLIYSIHFHCSLLLFLVIIKAGIYLLKSSGSIFTSIFQDELGAISLLTIVLTIFNFEALRNVYRQSRLLSLLKAFILFPIEIFLMLAVYRPVLLYYTLYSL